jgi:hypothetical protein
VRGRAKRLRRKKPPGLDVGRLAPKLGIMRY